MVSVLSAQEYCEWTEPVLITDTNSVYANPAIGVYGGSSWVFYEKHDETTSIYKMDLNDTSENVVLLTSESINYTNPCFYYNMHTNRIGYLLYLSDEEEISNLYIVELFENDSLGTTTKLSKNVTGQGVMDFSFASYTRNIAFTTDSVVVIATLKTLVDSVYLQGEYELDSSSYNIQSGFHLALWQKTVADSSLILKSQYLHNPDSGFAYWREPEYLDSIGNSNYLITSRLSDFWFGDIYHLWVKNDTVFASEYGGDAFVMNTNSKPNVREISLVNWGMGVKKEMWDMHYLCFTTGLGDSSEIFSSQEFCSENGFYISNNNIPDDNPEVYFGEFAGGGSGGAKHYVYCIWQTHINGNIALSMSKSVAEFTWSIDEKTVIDDYLKVSPNPFHNQLSVDFNSHGKIAQLKIVNVYGQQIGGFDNLNSNSNWHKVNWQPTTKLSKGLYLVVLSIEGKEYVRKVVLQ